MDNIYSLKSILQNSGLRKKVKGLKQYQDKYEECFRDGQRDEFAQKSIMWKIPLKTSIIDCMWISACVLT